MSHPQQTTSNPLQERLQALRSRVQTTLFLQGAAWLIAVAATGVFAAGFSDWLFHWNDPGVRVIFGVALLAACGWVAYTRLWLPLSFTFSDHLLAQRVERRYPGFRDALASTVEFSAANADPRIGSPELQTAVIRATMQATRHLDFSDVVDSGPMRRTSAMTVGLLMTFGLVAVLDLNSSGIALRRLFSPFSGVNWPRLVEWQLLTADLTPLTLSPNQPLRLATGENFRFFAENANGPLPRNVALEMRTGDVVQRENLRPAPQRDTAGNTRAVAAAQLASSKSEFEFRVVGGDDDTVWYPVQVIPAPAIESLQVTLTPPPYSRQTATVLPEGVGHVQGLVGTQVRLQLKSNKPLSAAVLNIKDLPPVTIPLGSDTTNFETTFAISVAGPSSYWLTLTDEQGFESRDPPRFELRGLEDSVPEVTISIPESDLLVTPNAEIPVQASARDDLGLVRFELQYTIERAGEGAGIPPNNGNGNGNGEQPNGVANPDGAPGTNAGEIATAAPATGSKLLWPTTAATTPPTEPAATSPAGSPPAIPADAAGMLPGSLQSDHLWKLAEFDLKPGSRFVFLAAAQDAFDLGEPHIGRSTQRTLTVVSPEEKSREMADRQMNLASDLERTLKQQNQARQQIEELQTQLKQAGVLRPQDVDSLQRAEMQQRQVEAQIANPLDGLSRRSQELVTELAQNQINDPETAGRFSRMADEFQRLSEEALPPIQDELTEARKTAQNSVGQKPNPPPTDRAPRGNAGRKPEPSSPKRPTDQNSGDDGKETSGDDQSTESPEKNASDSSETDNTDKNAAADKSATGKSSSGKSPSGKSASENGSGEPDAEQDGKQGEESTSGQDSSGETPSADKSSSEKSPGKKSPGEKSSDGKTPGKTEPDNNQSENNQNPAQTDKPTDNPPSPSDAAQPETSDSKAQLQALERIAGNQSAVAESLGEMLKDLNRWRSERDTAEEVAEMRTEQQRLQEDSAEVAASTLGKSREELTPQQRADLARLAQRQREQADRLDQLEKRMQEMQQKGDNRSPENGSQRKPEESNPEPAGSETLRAALEQMQQDEIAQDMRNAAAQLNNNRTGEAANSQQSAAQKLEALEQQLRDQAGGSDTESMVKKMQEIEQQLNQLQDEQKELMQKLQAASENTDPERAAAVSKQLKSQMQAVREQIKKLQRDLERLQIRGPEQDLDDALQRLELAEQQLENGDLDAAAKQQQEVLDDLQSAEEQLAEQRKEAQERLAVEQLAKIADELAAMIGRQQTVIDETIRLDKLAKERGSLGRSQLKTLRDLADTQLGLQAETLRLAEKLSIAEVFALSVRGAARSMELAAARLNNKETGESVQRLEKSAQQRFVDLVATLNEKQSQNAGGNVRAGGAAGGAGGGGAEQQEPDGIPTIAELKMLRTLQNEVLEQTAALNQQRQAAGQLTDAEKVELEALARLQAEIADLTRNLTEIVGDDEPDQSDQPIPGAKGSDGTKPDTPAADSDDQSDQPLPDEPVGEKPADGTPPPPQRGSDDPLPD